MESLQNELSILSNWIYQETENKSSSKDTAEKLFESWEQRSNLLLSQLESDKRVQKLFHNALCGECIEEIQNMKKIN